MKSLESFKLPQNGGNFLELRTIIFSGVDGSGKTRHATMLEKELNISGVSVKRCWIRGYGLSFFSFPTLVLCRWLGFTKVKRLTNGLTISNYNLDFRPLNLIWPWLQLFDSFLFIFLYCSLLKAYSKVLLMDRSIIDLFVDLCADIEGINQSKFFENLFLQLVPKKSAIFIFDIDELVAMSRKNDVQSINYLKQRRNKYCALQKENGWYKINTNECFKITHPYILNLLGVPQ